MVAPTKYVVLECSVDVVSTLSYKYETVIGKFNSKQQQNTEFI